MEKAIACLKQGCSFIAGVGSFNFFYEKTIYG